MKKNILFILMLVFCNLLFGDKNQEIIEDILTKLKPLVLNINTDIKRAAVYGLDGDKSLNLVSIQDQIINAIIETGKFQMIDRKSLSVLIAEQKLSLSGLVDDTGEMINTGKLLGVQGFFFGTIEKKNNEIILTLKLVNTETGAIIFSKKIIGRSSSFVEIGGGFCAIDSTISSSNRLNNTYLPGEFSPSIGILLSYKQGLNLLKFVNFGADIWLSGTFSSDTSTTLRRAHIKPKIYLSTSKIFNTEREIFSPYLGYSISMFLLGDKATTPTSITGAPIFGFDIYLTDFLTLTLESAYYFNNVLLRENTKTIEFGYDSNIDYYLTQGLNLGVAVRLNFLRL